jgi:hypothetical protein
MPKEDLTGSQLSPLWTDSEITVLLRHNLVANKPSAIGPATMTTPHAYVHTGITVRYPSRHTETGVCPANSPQFACRLSTLPSRKACIDHNSATMAYLWLKGRKKQGDQWLASNPAQIIPMPETDARGNSHKRESGRCMKPVGPQSQYVSRNRRRKYHPDAGPFPRAPWSPLRSSEEVHKGKPGERSPVREICPPQDV